MRRLTYENSRGESITFYRSPFLITSLTGIGEVDVEIQSQKSPYQDGDTFIDKYLQPRFIELVGIITETEPRKIKQYRREITRVCNAKFGIGKITLEMDGDTHVIHGTLDGGVVFPERGSSPVQQFMITWKCPNPYWQSQKIKAKPLFEPLFKFPFSGKFRMGYQRDRQIILNDGDVATPLYIELFGPAVAPKITNETTGEFIRVNRELSEGEHLRINTARGRQKSVIHVDANGTETNAFHWIDLESTFFQLELGENVLVYSADSNIQGATINIEYRKLYVSV